MTIAAFATGTQSATVTTEHFLSSPNVAGQFRLLVKLSNMVAGDRLELRQYKIPLTGGATVAKLIAAFEGAQPTDDAYYVSEWLPNDLAETNAVRYSLKQTFGTSRDFDWVVYRETDQADVTKWNGTAVASPHTAGYPVVTVKDGTGTGEIDTASGKVFLADDSIGASTIIDSGGNALTFVEIADIVAGLMNALLASYTDPGSLSDFIQDIQAAITALNNLSTTDILTALASHTGTAQAGAAGTITLASGASATDDLYNDQEVWIKSGTGAGQVRHISDYVGSTRVASITPNWATTPDNTSVYYVLPAGRVDVGAWVDGAPNALSGGRVDARVGAMAADVLTAAAIAADVTTELQSGLATASALSTLQTSVDDLPTNAELATALGAADDPVLAVLGSPAGASLAADLADIEGKVDDLESRLGTPSNLGGGATIAANLADIEAQTDDIGAAGAGLTALPWNAAWDAEVQSEANDALVANNLDHLLATAVAGADVVDNSVIAKLVSKSAAADWDSFDNTTDALEALRDRGDAAWTTATGFSTLDAAGVRSAVGLASANLDTQLADLPTNTELTTALGTADDAVLAAIAGLNNLSAAQVNAEVDTALADYDAPTNAEMVARTLAAASYATATALNDVDNFVDTEMAAVKAVTDKLDTALELDGAVYRFTTNALEQAPSAGGGGLDAAGVRAAIGMASANMDTQLGNITAKTNLITANNLTVASPVAPSTQVLTLVRGDDYSTESGRALPEWSSDDWTPYDLSTAVVTFKARGKRTNSTLTVTANVITDTLVRVQLTSAQTAALSVGDAAYLYDLEAVLAGGDVVTLVRGTITVLADVS